MTPKQALADVGGMGQREWRGLVSVLFALLIAVLTGLSADVYGDVNDHSARIAVIETKQQARDKQLERIEAKLDSVLERLPSKKD